MSLSKTMLIGNLGQDPTTHRFENGGQVTNFSIATTEKWTDKETKEKKEKTEWMFFIHQVVRRAY